MKALRFFLILFMLTFATAIHAESISINPVTFITGQRTVAIPINCEFTSENITLYQFDLYLPDGVTLAKNADDSYESGITYELSERHKNHTATLKDKSGFVRCVVLNNTNSTIYPGSGLLLTLYVQADADISGDLQCSIKNFMMFESDETKHSMSDTSFAIINLDMLSGKTFTLHCARGYVCGVTQLEGTPFAKYASEFAIVEYNNQTYLYNVGQKKFVVHTNAAQAGLTDNKMLLSKDDFSNIVTGLKWGETGIASYPYYLEDSFGNWMNMESGYVFMNTWKDFEDGNGGNTYAVTIVDADFDDSEAIAMLDAYFNPPATVTYVISDKNGIVFTSEPLPTKPGVVITELPSKLKRDYCYYTLTESTITTGANTVKVNVYYSLPFKLSTSFENAVWYYATIRGSKYLRADENAKDDSGRYMTSSTNRKTASYRWAFFGNPYTCFYIANMGAGEGKYLYASDVPTMQTIENPTATEAALWVPSANSNGFSLRSITGANLYLNDNGQTGNLGFWDSSNAANDVGSRWNIEEIINATGISLNQTSATLTSQGQTLQLSATVTPRNASNKSVTWTSSNTSVATVSSTGLVTAVSNGSATITAKTADGSNKTATCTVTVNIPVLATGISLNQTSATLTSQGQTLQLSATVTPSNASNKSVTWTSSNTSVATVSSTGLVTAVSNGSATITAKTADGSNKTATCTVTVNIPVLATGISLNQTSASLTTKGQTLQLSATVTPSNASNKSVTWTSSNTSVATVSSTGLVTAVSNGSATITAKTADGSNKTATCEITVSLQLSYILDYSSRTASISGLISSNTEEIVIPATVMYNGTNYSVTSIEANAFEKCSNLRSITIPNSVTSIGNSAFLGCSGLTAVHISDLAAWCKISFKNYFSNPVSYAHKLYLNDNEIQNLVIPNSVTSIGSSAFYGCSGLTSVTIPNSVTSIGSSAFCACSNLTSATIPEGVTSIGNDAFYGCKSLTSVTIPNSVTSIGYDAFSGCSALTSVTIPNSVTSIGEHAFAYCSGLTSVTLNANDIVSKTYSLNSNLGTIFGSQVKEYVLGDDVKGIGNYAFYRWCSGLTSVTIPNSVTSIGDFAFNSCRNLTSITIGSGVTSISANVFYNCNNLTAVTLESNAIVSATRTSSTSLKTIFGEQVKEYIIGNGVNTIGDNAFRSCNNLTSVTIGENVKSIGNYAFNLCGDLTSVTIGEGVTNIGNYAFMRCGSLTEATIPNSVTNIGNSAFRYCTALNTLTIGNSVNKIGSFAFANNTELADVTCLAEQIPTTSTNAFNSSNPENATLHVPSSAIEDYKATAPWSSFGTIVALEPTYIVGDANGNGEVEIGDVTSVLTLMATPEATGYNNKAADANGNGEIEIGDVTTILTIMASGN